MNPLLFAILLDSSVPCEGPEFEVRAETAVESVDLAFLEREGCGSLAESRAVMAALVLGRSDDELGEALGAARAVRDVSEKIPLFLTAGAPIPPACSPLEQEVSCCGLLHVHLFDCFYTDFGIGLFRGYTSTVERLVGIDCPFSALRDRFLGCSE